MPVRNNARKKLQSRQYPTSLLPHDVVKNILQDYYTLNLNEFLNVFMGGALLSWNSLDKKSKSRKAVVFAYLKEMYCCWGVGEARKVELLVTRLVVDNAIKQEALLNLRGLREISFEGSFGPPRQFFEACCSSLRVLQGIGSSAWALDVLTDFKFPHLHSLHFDISRKVGKPHGFQQTVSYFPSKVTSLQVPYDISDCFPQLQRLKHLDAPVDINEAATHLTQLISLSTSKVGMLNTPFDSLRVFIYHTELNKSELNSILSNCINLTRIKCVLGLASPDSYVGSGQLVEAVFSLAKSSHSAEVEYDESLENFTTSLINSNKDLRVFKCPLLCNDALVSKLKPNRVHTLEGFQFEIEEEWEKLGSVFPDVCHLTVSGTSSDDLAKVLQALPSITTLGLHTCQRETTYSLFSYISVLKEYGEKLSSIEVDMHYELAIDVQHKSLGLLISELPHVTCLTVAGGFSSVKSFSGIETKTLKQVHILPYTSGIMPSASALVEIARKLEIEGCWLYRKSSSLNPMLQRYIRDRIRESKVQRIV